MAVDKKKKPEKRNFDDKHPSISQNFGNKRQKMTAGVQIVSHQTHGLQAGF